MQEIKIQLHPAQDDFCRSPAVYRGYVGGRGAGKSFVGAFDLLCRALDKPGRLFGLYAPSYPLLRDSSLRSFLAIGAPFISLHNKSDGMIRLVNGAEIICRSLDDPEKSGRGPNLSGAWFDEAGLVEKTAYDLVIACLREGGERGWLSATFTPKGRAHWTAKVFSGDNPDAALFHSRTSDNPFLPPGFRDSLASQYTSHFAAQELEGQFIDPPGNMAKREWFRIVDAHAAGARSCRAWDLAATASASADWTVGALVSVNAEVFTICHLTRAQIAGGSIEGLVRQTAQMDGHGVPIVMEQEPGSSGKIAASYLIKELSGYNVRAVPATGDKVTRAMPFLAQAEAGNVRLVRGHWVDAFLDEITTFPAGAHDDQVDAVSLAFNSLTRPQARMIYAN